MDAMIGRVVQLLVSAGPTARAQVVVLAVTADHSTPVVYGDHAHEAVPVVIAAVGGQATTRDDVQRASLLAELLRADSGVERFDEVSCSRGVLGRFPGSELLPTVERFCNLVSEHYR